MSQIEKLEAHMRNNSVGVKYSDLKKVLQYYNFIERDGKGSHVNFSHPKLKDVRDLVTVPVHNGKVKSIYVKKALDKIDKVKNK